MNILLFEFTYAFHRSQDVFPKRMPGENLVLKIIKDLFGRGILVRSDLINYDLFLFFNLFGWKYGVEQDILKKFQGPVIIFIQERGMDAGLFLGGIGIQVRPDIFQPVQDVVEVSLLGSFEDGMFDEMGNPVFLLGSSSRVPAPMNTPQWATALGTSR